MNDRLLHKKSYIILFIVYSLSFIVANAQTRKIDSLFAVLKTEKEDTNRANTLNTLATVFMRRGNYAKADSLVHESMQLSQKINHKKGIASAYRIIGILFFDKGNFPNALANYFNSLKIDSAIGNKPGMGTTYIRIGDIYKNEGNYAEALKYHSRALNIYSESGDKIGMADSYINIGVSYEYLGNYPDAVKYLLLSLHLNELTGNKRGMASAYGSLGNVYGDQGKYSEALNNNMKALKLFEEMGNMRNIAFAYGNIGSLYMDMGKYSEALQSQLHGLEIDEKIGDKQSIGIDYLNIGIAFSCVNNYSEAMKYLREAIKITVSIGDNYNTSGVYIAMGKVFTKQGRYQEAKELLDSGLVISKKINAKDILLNSYKSLSCLDSAMNNYKAAFTDYKNYTIYKDSLNNDDYTKKITQEQMQYEFDKKQTEEKAEQDKKDVLVAADKKKQHIITGFISGGLILVLASLGLLFSRFKVTQKQKKIIERQKSEVERQKTLVEEKNKDIIDSITYAKRLQSAILPPISLVKQFFPESFILYKPKDIVAGDFYWMQRLPRPAGEGRGEVILIAAADCTGHGVPGAMVSVVCSNAINRIVKETEVRDTGSVLDNVRNVVLETFSTSEGEVKDGMDISFCAINRQANILEWTGANNPLWYIHKNKLIEIAPDKQPVGIQDNPKPFTTHLVNIEKGDIIYLFTDGYADQFGGPKGKKFKYKQLQEKLLAIAHLTMEEQKAELENTLETWKGSLEQVDDILVMGIRI